MSVNLETIKRRATINLNPSTRPQVVDVSQYDSGYTLVFNIIEDQSDALKHIMRDTDAEISATLQGVKPSGAGYQIAQSQFTEPYELEYTLDASMTDEAGDVPSEIVFYIVKEAEGEEPATQRVATANFTLRVKKSPYPANNVLGG